ncbi:Os07g0239000, partial [Oryza sativa Japonica Group]
WDLRVDGRRRRSRSFCRSCPAASSSAWRPTCTTATGGGGECDTTTLLRRLPPRFAAKRKRDTWMIPHVQNALRHYNARHPGGEFDVVKPLMQARVVFKGQHWFHINFWARSRSSNKIKRFFAELHYKPLITISGFKNHLTSTREAAHFVRPGLTFCTPRATVSLFAETTRTGFTRN